MSLTAQSRRRAGTTISVRCAKQVVALPASLLEREELAKKFSAILSQKSEPEVFILESLQFEDEAAHRFEGKVLSDVLAMCEKRPAYFYFRTARELEAIAEVFQKSRSRYLHISCHGTPTELVTTLERIPFVKFAEILGGKLNNRRLFISACSVGSDLSAEVLKGRNPRLYSIAAPECDIPFSQAVAFWTASYTTIFGIDKRAMTDRNVETTLLKLCELFETHISWTYRTDNQWTTRTLGRADRS